MCHLKKIVLNRTRAFTLSTFLCTLCISFVKITSLNSQFVLPLRMFLLLTEPQPPKTHPFAWQFILILKIRNVGGSTIDAERINSQLRVKRQSPLLILGGLMIDTKRINSQLSLSRVKTIISVYPGGGGDQWSTQRGSTVNFHFCVNRWSPLLIGEGGIDAPPLPRHSVHSTGWPLLVLIISKSMSTTSGKIDTFINLNI